VTIKTLVLLDVFPHKKRLDYLQLHTNSENLSYNLEAREQNIEAEFWMNGSATSTCYPPINDKLKNMIEMLMSIEFVLVPEGRPNHGGPCLAYIGKWLELGFKEAITIKV